MPNDYDKILSVLDRCAGAYTFPMLDNGYIYLAAARLSLFRSETDWALVTEVFGFSPRAGIPDVHVQTFASQLHERDTAEKYVSRAAYETYLQQHPNDETRFFFPLEEGQWIDTGDGELVQPDARDCRLRGHTVAIPDRTAFAAAGIDLIDPDRIRVFELCRYLAAAFRDEVLATPAERRGSVGHEMVQLLQLDDWTHPDLVNGELPSATESFRQLARVLETGDVRYYAPSRSGNTHWKNWPDGGSL